MGLITWQILVYIQPEKGFFGSGTGNLFRSGGFWVQALDVQKKFGAGQKVRFHFKQPTGFVWVWR